MSESVTNVQIEDVLSSIRKLVSEEVRAQTKEVKRDAQADPIPRAANGSGDVAPDDRLLLTPAHRVHPGRDTTEDEAPFTHAEAPAEEADLLDLMARVRAAGISQTDIDRKRPIGIAAVKPAQSDDPVTPTPATEAAIRSALVALGGVPQIDEDGQGTDEATADDQTAAAATEDDLDTDAADTPYFAALDDRITDEGDEPLVPKFLHRNGITSLGQRIAEVETVVSTSGGDWEPEVDEEGEAAPERQMSSVPWDDPAADLAAGADVAPEAESDPIEEAPFAEVEPEQFEDDDWSVAPAPQDRDFLDRPFARTEPPLTRSFVTEDAADDIAAAFETTVDADTSGEIEEDISLTVPQDDDIVGQTEFYAAAPTFDDAAEDEGFDTHVEDVTEPRAAASATEDDTPDVEAPPVFRRPTIERPTLDRTTGETPIQPEPQAAPVSETPAYSFDDVDDVADDRDALVADDPTLFDEEMLRDLVSEIVRQELQGALGERITRNVRKLVRREIHRALSAQDLR